MNPVDQMQKKLYRAGMVGGGLLIGFSFLEPVLAAVSPFLPLIAAVLSGLITGLVVKGIFNFAVNTKLNQSYRYSDNDAGSGTGGGSAAASGQRTQKPKQRAEEEPPRREPPPRPPPSPDSRVLYRKILGLGEQYTPDELKAAYRDCATKFHPDRYVNASERERRRAEEMMKNINEAYHALL
ncbi:MAG: J domain-containing protein [Spirochaetaceae bacterium]|jgi:hypothetical protein|nr:J domain-containing protein [Spirochaetaceae bacterium]